MTYRLLLRRIGGVGLVTMEFVSSEGLTRGNRRTERLLRFDPAERPLSVQIYGADAARMADAAERVEEMQVDVCDINMGCPANKVLKGCAGAGLMRDLGKAREIIAACRKALPTTPLTVKFRLGVDGRDGELPRARADLRRRGRRRRRAPRADGEADVHGARRLEPDRAAQGGGLDPGRRQRRRETPEDVVAMFRETGCDAVMCGRATMKNPWIFRQAADLLAGRPYREATLEERREVILEHFRLIQKDDGGRAEGRHAKLRTFTGWYTHGLPNGSELRRRIPRLEAPQAFLDAVEDFFEPHAASGGLRARARRPEAVSTSSGRRPSRAG